MACELCRARKMPIQKVGWLASKPATKMWSQVAMDFGGPYPESVNGMKYVLVMIDQFSKYVEIVATEKNDAATVLSAFNERIICRHGCPERLLTDNHRQFKNFALDAVCHAFGCFKSYCSKYYPQGDGHVERFMRNMNDTLSILCDGNSDDWDHYIPGVQFAYNTTVHSVTGITPFFLNHLREPRIPFTENYETHLEENRKKLAPTQYARKLRNVIINVRQQATNAIARAWLVSAKAYNRGRTAVRINVGDHVMIRTTPALQEKSDLQGKFPLRWSKPMLVTQTRSSGKAFEVCDPDTKAKHVINATRMLPIPPDSWRVDKQHLGKVMRDLAAYYQQQQDAQAEEHIPSVGFVRRNDQLRDTPVASYRETNRQMEQIDVQPRLSLPRVVTDSHVQTVDVDTHRTTTGVEAQFTTVSLTEDPPTHMEDISLLTLGEMAIADGEAAEGVQHPEVALGEQTPNTLVNAPTTEILNEYLELDRDRHTLLHPDFFYITEDMLQIYNDESGPPPDGTYPSAALTVETPEPAQPPRERQRREPTRRYTRSQRNRDLESGRDISDFFQ